MKKIIVMDGNKEVIRTKGDKEKINMFLTVLKVDFFTNLDDVIIIHAKNN